MQQVQDALRQMPTAKTSHGKWNKEAYRDSAERLRLLDILDVAIEDLARAIEYEPKCPGPPTLPLIHHTEYKIRGFAHVAPPHCRTLSGF